MVYLVRYWDLWQFLVNNGYNVLLFDYREIGESTPIDLKLSEAFMHDWGILDMSAAFNYAVEVQNLTNIVWIRLSVGGQLVGVLEKREHIKHLIFISGALGYWGYFLFPMKAVVWTLWYAISPVLTKLYGYGTLKKLGWGKSIALRFWNSSLNNICVFRILFYTANTPFSRNSLKESLPIFFMNVSI